MATHGVPAFMKVDVEGAERLVFAGMSKPPRALCFEFTYRFLEDASGCIRRLDSLGKAEFNFTPYEKMELVGPAWLGASETIARLESRKAEGLVGGDIFARFR
jgi:hypothetical protein